MRINDDRIYKLLKEHDPRGMEMLFENYYRPLVLWADSFLNDIPASEDIVQDFFLNLWETKVFARITPKNIRGYLFTSVKNSALKLMQKRDLLRNSNLLTQLLPDILDPDDLTEEMLNALQKEIENLPPRTRDIIKAVYYDGMRYKEVAEKFRISVATVKTLLVNALKKLRSIFSFPKAFFY